jgi:hypothetical protein
MTPTYDRAAEAERAIARRLVDFRAGPCDYRMGFVDGLSTMADALLLARPSDGHEAYLKLLARVRAIQAEGRPSEPSRSALAVRGGGRG